MHTYHTQVNPYELQDLQCTCPFAQSIVMFYKLRCFGSYTAEQALDIVEPLCPQKEE